MNTKRMSKKHQKFLDKLLAKWVLQENINPRKNEAKTPIEQSEISEDLFSANDKMFHKERVEIEMPLEDDPAWKDLDLTYSLGIEDLSEKMDEYLYEKHPNTP